MIFPVFVNVLWANAAVNIFIGFIAFSFTFAPYNDDPDSVYSFSVMYGLQHLGKLLKTMSSFFGKVWRFTCFGT